MLDSIASKTPIFFKVKWFPGYIFAYSDLKQAESGIIKIPVDL